MSQLVFAVPSKGRLQEQTLTFFADCGLSIEKAGGQRGYAASMPALPSIEVRLLSAADIAAGLKDGEIHAGVTGEDLLRELGTGFERVVLVKPLGFGRADLVVAVPSAWLDVTTMSDLDAVSAAHRASQGRRLRVATKYIRQAHAFFDARGVDDYRIVESLGATEGAPAGGAAEVVVDITTTGSTLAANHLKVLSDGLILRSQAQIAASRAADWNADSVSAFCRVLDQIEARERGKSVRLVRAATGGAERAALEGLIADAIGEPPAEDGSFVAAYVPSGHVADLCAAFTKAGAGPVGVFAADYVFERIGAYSAAFKKAMHFD
jgi:ATP phosphoribosyltransferase